MLSSNRQYFVTGSQASRVMAGYEEELVKPLHPDFESSHLIVKAVSDFYEEHNKCPLVRDIVNAGFKASSPEVKECFAYVKSLKPIFTDGMLSYAREIAKHQLVTEPEETFRGYDMERGNEQEHLAVEAFEKVSGLSFDFTGDEQEFLNLDYLGLTPDGAHYDDLFMIDQGLEVKCPKQDIHMKNLHLLKTQDDLLREYPAYYWQCMTGLAVTTAHTWNFATYNGTFKEGYQVVHLEVKPVQKHIDILLKRSQAVIEKSREILKEVTGEA